MKKLYFALLLGTISLFSSCGKCDDDQVVCTEEFRRITLSVDNSTQLPVSLDEAYTLRGNSTQKLFFEQSPDDGNYVVLDDSYHSELINAEDDFRFIGVKNNQVVVDQTFRIAGDNCHVFKKTGPDTILIP